MKEVDVADRNRTFWVVVVVVGVDMGADMGVGMCGYECGVVGEM